MQMDVLHFNGFSISLNLCEMFFELLSQDVLHCFFMKKNTKKCCTVMMHWPGHVVLCFFCCFMSQSTAMVMAGQSVHLTTLFPGQA